MLRSQLPWRLILLLSGCHENARELRVIISLDARLNVNAFAEVAFALDDNGCPRVDNLSLREASLGRFKSLKIFRLNHDLVCLLQRYRHFRGACLVQESISLIVLINLFFCQLQVDSKR